MRWCWVIFHCVLLNWISVGQGPTVRAVGASWGCLDNFTLLYSFSPLSPSLWETTRYRLKYCLKGPLNPKQPTTQLNSLVCTFVVLNRATFESVSSIQMIFFLFQLCLFNEATVPDQCNLVCCLACFQSWFYVRDQC